MELSRKIGDMEYDGLVIGTTPAVDVHSGTIRKLSAVTILKRGTLLAKSSRDNKLVILGTTAAAAVEAVEGVEAVLAEVLTPYAVLTDDTEVGTTDDVVTTVYTAGRFNTNKCIVKEGHTLSDSEIDDFRKYNIIFQSALE